MDLIDCKLIESNMFFMYFYFIFYSPYYPQDELYQTHKNKKNGNFEHKK